MEWEIEDDPIGSYQYSYFILTINPNKAFTSRAEAKQAKDQLQIELTELFSSLEDYFSVYEQDGRRMKKTYLSLDSITRSAKLRPRIEIGTKMKRLHSHTLISLEHQSDYRVRMNLKKLRQDLPEGYHLDVKYSQDHTALMKRYVEKNQ